MENPAHGLMQSFHLLVCQAVRGPLGVHCGGEEDLVGVNVADASDEWFGALSEEDLAIVEELQGLIN